MKRFEAYLIRLKIGFRKNKSSENELRLVQAIHDAYIRFRDEPDLTDEEKEELADELRKANERRRNDENSSRD